MRNLQMKGILKNFYNGVNRHSPEILTGIGIAGMLTTTILAVKATPKAMRLINKEINKKGEDLTPMETVKVAWKPYVPSMITGTMSAVCLVGATSVSTRRTATIAAAYKLSESALKEFKEKTVEVVGEDKVKEIKEKITEDKIKNNPVSKNEVIITGTGNALCFDTLSGRYFESDISKIQHAVNEINRQMTYDMYVSLNEFYDELGLSQTKLGDELGWNLDDGLLEIVKGSKISDDGRPCITIDYNVAPRYDFSKLG